MTAVVLAASALAGPLNPPPGPVQSTGKTLSEVEPRRPISAATTPGNNFATFRINQPGSYYLTQNLVGESGKRTIEIAASNVTLDLNGFDIRGVSGSFEGIRAVAPDMQSIVVRNGMVRAASTGTPSMQAVDLANVRGGVVEGVIVRGSGQGGIAVGADSSVIDCTVLDSAGHGIEVGEGSIVERSVASGNEGRGIDAAAGAVIRGCRAIENGSDGIRTLQNSIVESSVARGNHAVGIAVVSGSRISGSTSSLNESHGIAVDSGVVLDCVVRGNLGHGIVVSSNSLVRGNHAVSNSGGAGIYVAGTWNRVEDNQAISNAVGYEVISFRNVIVRNTAGGNNSNWSVALGNHIHVVEMTPSGAFQGDFGGFADNAANPDANITYLSTIW